MSGSYWGVGENVQINQSDIEIKADGADTFTSNQVIGVYIPPSVRFFSGADTTIDFDVELKLGGAIMPTKLCLDGQTGANSLFSKCVIYAGNRQTVLETLNEYNSWVSVKYSYDTNDAIKSRRAITEGCGEWTSASRGTCGSTKSVQNNHMYSPYNELANKNVAATETVAAKTPYTKASVSLPIHMGCFANSKKAFPNLLTDGCYIEMTLAPDARVFRLMDSVVNNRKKMLNPQFHSVDGAGTVWGAADNAITEFYTWPANNQSNPQHSPFQVGEKLKFLNLDTGLNVLSDSEILITGIAVGTADAPVKYTFAATGVATAVDGAIHKFAVVSLAGDDTVMKPTYEISNVRVKVRQLDIQDYEKGMMARMKSGGVVEFDLPSVACALQSAVATDLQAVVNIPCEHAKARSLICQGTDATSYATHKNMDSTDTYQIDALEPNMLSNGTIAKETFSDRSGISGIGDYLTHYSFNIDGKIVPSRRIETTLTSGKTKGINQGHLIELEKALNQSHETPPRCFADYRSNFLIGRALTLDPNTVYDGRGRDIRLLLSYEGTAPDKNKLWKTFISHIKTISIRGDSITVLN